MAANKYYIDFRVTDDNQNHNSIFGSQRQSFEFGETIEEVTSQNGVFLDADKDSYLISAADDTVDVYINGAKDFTLTANTLSLQSGSSIQDSAGTMYAGFFPTIAAQALSGAGAVNVTSFLTKFTSTGAAQALTIASGTVVGQRKKVLHIVDGGSGVLTGVFVGGTTITFTTANEFADLIWTGSAWGVLELGNYTAGGAAPALA